MPDFPDMSEETRQVDCGGCGTSTLSPTGLCLICDKQADERDAWTDAHCQVCQWTTQGAPCPRCAEEIVLEVGIDPGADGAYAWEVTLGGCLLSPIVDHHGVRSIGADERVVKGGKTKAGKAKVRRLASAECLALELSGIVTAVRGQLQGRPLRLVAHLEVPPAAPGQSSSTTASQHRSLGRIEGVLVALGFEVHLTRPPVWRAALGMVKVGDTLGTDDARAKQKLAKDASLALAKALRPDLEDRIGEDDNRAEAVLVMIAGRKLRLEREGL